MTQAAIRPPCRVKPKLTNKGENNHEKELLLCRDGRLLDRDSQ